MMMMMMMCEVLHTCRPFVPSSIGFFWSCVLRSLLWPRSLTICRFWKISLLRLPIPPWAGREVPPRAGVGLSPAAVPVPLTQRRAARLQQLPPAPWLGWAGLAVSPRSLQQLSPCPGGHKEPTLEEWGFFHDGGSGHRLPWRAGGAHP